MLKEKDDLVRNLHTCRCPAWKRGDLSGRTAPSRPPADSSHPALPPPHCLQCRAGSECTACPPVNIQTTVKLDTCHLSDGLRIDLRLCFA